MTCVSQNLWHSDWFDVFKLWADKNRDETQLVQASSVNNITDFCWILKETVHNTSCHEIRLRGTQLKDSENLNHPIHHAGSVLWPHIVTLQEVRFYWDSTLLALIRIRDLNSLFLMCLILFLSDGSVGFVILNE